MKNRGSLSDDALLDSPLSPASSILKPHKQIIIHETDNLTPEHDISAELCSSVDTSPVHNVEIL